MMWPVNQQSQNPDAENVTFYRVAIILPDRVTTLEAGHVEIVFSELMESLATSHLRLADQRWIIVEEARRMAWTVSVGSIPVRGMA